MDMVTERMRTVFEDSGWSVRKLAKRLGYEEKNYTTVYRYIKGDSNAPAEFVLRVAEALGVPIEEMFGPDLLLYVTVGAYTDEERAAVDAVEFPEMTVTELQVFRSVLARWVKAEAVDFPERLKRMGWLLDTLQAPIDRFDVELGPRELTDYRLSMFTALGLAVPKRGK